MSSLSSQHGSLQFIDEGSTRRKEIIAKFLDLEIFDQKFKMAKEESVETKAILKKLDGRDYDSEILEAQADLMKCHNDIAEHESECEELNSEIEQHKLEYKQAAEKIDSIPAEIIDIVTVKKDISEKEEEISNLQDSIRIFETVLQNKSSKYRDIVDFIEGFDIQRLRDKKEKIKI